MKQMETTIEIKLQSDVVHARQLGRNLAIEFGFRTTDQTRLATAISELARNVLAFAGAGNCTIVGETEMGNSIINVVMEDNGPGILDINQAMQDGFSTANSLGAGLPGTKRLVDEFEIQSRPGKTRIKISMSRKTN